MIKFRKYHVISQKIKFWKIFDNQLRNLHKLTLVSKGMNMIRVLCLYITIEYQD